MNLSAKTNNRPIGVFDSGIGGLSILKSMIEAMPQQEFIYLADTAYAPYGERSDAYILERSRSIAQFMHDEQHTAGLVIACNTATAAAGKTLREEYSEQWPIIGVEPALKPAASMSATGKIAIMATASTLGSQKFKTLIERVKTRTTQPLDLFLCPCDGLAKAIEDQNDAEVESLVKRYTAKVKAAASDVVVMGCTHYCLIEDLIAKELPQAHILDTGEAVARRAQEVIPVASQNKNSEQPRPKLTAWTNANKEQLEAALKHWLPHAPAEVKLWMP